MSTQDNVTFDQDALEQAIDSLGFQPVDGIEFDKEHVIDVTSAFLNGELDDKIEAKPNLSEYVTSHEEVLANVVKAVEGNYTMMAQALAITALKVEHQSLAWWKAAQAVGLGTPGKDRSGGGSARQRALIALGVDTEDEKVATKAFGRARQARREEEAEQAELQAIKKGGGYYELIPPAELDGELVDSVRGQDSVPEGYTIVDPEAA